MPSAIESTPATAPNPHELLPPLLACLPTAAFSPRPPPALSALVTPIIKQRLNLLTITSSADTWLTLLNWDREKATKLPGVVENMLLEAHPVSGEVEIQDVEVIEYKKLDAETLHVRLDVEEFGLLPTFLWCMADKDNGGTGWRLAELAALEDKDTSTTWSSSISAAEAEFKSRGTQSQSTLAVPNSIAQDEEDEEDDGAYWAAYDMTPGRTPNKRSPAPRGNGLTGSFGNNSKAEMEYFERYMNEVQPAMDPYDAEEDHGTPGDSSLDHHRREFAETQQTQAESPQNTTNEIVQTATRDPLELVISVPDTPHQPRPSSSHSSSGSVRALEDKAETQSQAEIGIKQHISTDLKSLYRLARSAGISTEEFERIVRTELEVLPLMELD